MTALKRITDILAANVNEFVERYEDPELLLKQAVREMDETIRVSLGKAAKVVAHERVLLRQVAAEEAAIAAAQRRAEVAVQRGDDPLAREMLSQKRDRQNIAISLTKQLVEVTQAARSLRLQIEKMRRRIEDARRKLHLLVARQQAATARRHLLCTFGDVALGDEAFQKFDRICRKVEQNEAETEALAELAQTCNPLDAWAEVSTRIDTEELDAEYQSLKVAVSEGTPQPTTDRE